MTTQFNTVAMWIKAHVKDDRGAAMVEYALLLVFIALVAVAALGFLGQTVSGQFSEIDSGLNG